MMTHTQFIVGIIVVMLLKKPKYQLKKNMNFVMIKFKKTFPIILHGIIDHNFYQFYIHMKVINHDQFLKRN